MVSLTKHSNAIALGVLACLLTLTTAPSFAALPEPAAEVQAAGASQPVLLDDEELAAIEALPDGVVVVPIGFLGAAAFAGYVHPDAPGYLVARSRCAENVTGLVRIRGDWVDLDFLAGRFSQVVRIQNTSNRPIRGPVSLVLDNLRPPNSLLNRSGVTTCTRPLGSPYRNVDVGPDNVLRPGEVASVRLVFSALLPRVDYRPRVLAGPGGR